MREVMGAGVWCQALMRPAMCRLSFPLVVGTRMRSRRRVMSSRRFSSSPVCAGPILMQCENAVLLENSLCDFVFDGSKLTTIAHSVWRHIVRPGDTVIDATCGNGYDTLMLARLVYGEAQKGYVYGIDLQQHALDKASLLLDQELPDRFQREHVRLIQMCHSKLEDLVVENSVRLVTFNLGYLPGGDKMVATRKDTTMEALQSATRVLKSQGLISIIAYVGHPGGREEYEAIRDFAAALSTNWVCTHHEWLNRPLGPHLMFLHKK